MMNVREYFESLMNVMDMDKVFGLEEKLYEMYDEDYEGFASYMKRTMLIWKLSTKRPVKRFSSYGSGTYAATKPHFLAGQHFN